MQNETFFWCVTYVVTTYQANKLDKFRCITEKRIVISMLPFTAEKEIFAIQSCKQ